MCIILYVYIYICIIIVVCIVYCICIIHIPGYVTIIRLMHTYSIYMYLHTTNMLTGSVCIYNNVCVMNDVKLQTQL